MGRQSKSAKGGQARGAAEPMFRVDETGEGGSMSLSITAPARKLIGSAKAFYRAFPRSFTEVRGVHREKVGLLAESGAKQIAIDAGRTAFNLLTARISLKPIDGGIKPEDLYRSYPLFRYLPDVVAVELANYLLPVTFPLVLRDVKRGYTCYQLPITPENMERVERARGLVAGALISYGYIGFSFEYDRKYDQNSSYLIVENKQGKIVASARVTIRLNGFMMPIEDGLTEDGKSYSFEKRKGEVAEINSFFYKKGDKASLRVLFAMLGRYAGIMGINEYYCLLDENNEKTARLYRVAGFRKDPLYGNKIHFPSFGIKTDEHFTPVWWDIMRAQSLPIFIQWMQSHLSFSS